MKGGTKDIWLIFLAIFSAGVVSMLMELSLLREFVYIFGSTAVSNAIIISVFLVGLAFGAYLGTWQALNVKSESEAKQKFVLIQLLSALFILLFLSRKSISSIIPKNPISCGSISWPLFSYRRSSLVSLMQSALKSCIGGERNSLHTFMLAVHLAVLWEGWPMGSFLSPCGGLSLHIYAVWFLPVCPYMRSIPS